MPSPDAAAIPHAPDLHPIPARSEVKHSIWPKMVIAFGLGLTAGWVILLGYGAVLLGSGLVRLVAQAI